MELVRNPSTNTYKYTEERDESFSTIVIIVFQFHNVNCKFIKLF